jgi:hypothetical protein
MGWKPYASRVLYRAVIGRRKIDRNQEYDAARKRKSQEDWHEKVRWCLSERQIVANGEEHQDGDGEEGEDGE